MSILHFIFFLIPVGIAMSAVQSPYLQDGKTDSLHTQQDYLNLLRRRHLHWMNDSDDPEIERIHLEIAELLRTTTELYMQLLDTLDNKK